MTQNRRRIIIVAFVALLSLVVSFSASAINQKGYRGGEVVLVDESDSCSSNLHGFRDGWEFENLKKSSWENGGVHGQAMRLTGKNDFLEYKDSTVFQHPFTVVGWINWKGTAEEADGERGEIDQHLFTVYRDNQNYVKVNLRHVQDNYKTLEDGTVYRIDSVAMEYALSGSTGKFVEAYMPPTTGAVTYAIPKNKWVHFALVVNDVNLELYVNGAKCLSKALPSGAKDLKATALRIGASLDTDDPTLNASIDDMALFPESLPEDYIAALAAGDKLSFEGNAQKTNYIPEEKEETTTTAKKFLGHEVSQRGTIPWFTWYVLAAVAVVFGVFVVIANLKPAEEEEPEEEENVEEETQKKPSFIEIPSSRPATKLQPVAAQQPVTKPQPVAVQQPATKPQPVAAQQPVAKPQTVAAQQPVARPQAGIPQQPVARPQAGIPQQPVARPQAGIPQQPVARPQAGIPQQSVARPQAGIPQQPVARPQAGIPQQPVARPQAGIPQQPVMRPQVGTTQPVQRAQQNAMMSKPAPTVRTGVTSPARSIPSGNTSLPTMQKPAPNVPKQPVVQMPQMPSSKEQAKKMTAIDDMIDDILLEKYLKSGQ